ncbi:hypothetical protein PROFUN_10032 [Planoprotostelium fungivorum]|uniref:DJ-1/PfpI domain-containing protein n=1 Tax=Planoprotostelium fungivorum TaxID=1890364 RepID=A0A2P6NFF3_9EUKA|nr:hypothetical protein PROFUN_10032 [Planoprotostelium fungivorum]
MTGKVLFVLTSHNTLLNGKPTGWYLPEAAHPYYVLSSQYTVEWASPAGGKAPLDPTSVEQFKEDAECQKFLKDEAAQNGVNNTKKLDSISEKDYDAIFYVGGHGPCFDLVDSSVSQKLISDFYSAGKPTAAVCHGPVVFTHVKDKDGKPLVAGKKVTCFTDEEEAQAQLTEQIPFLVEKKLRELGAVFEKADKPWGCKVCVEGNFITGQNPASAGETGKAILSQLKK